LGDRITLELICELVCGHLVLLASKITKQGVYKSRGYSVETVEIVEAMKGAKRDAGVS
jgi:ketopantoate hydroxymethyltransferase